MGVGPRASLKPRSNQVWSPRGIRTTAMVHDPEQLNVPTPEVCSHGTHVGAAVATLSLVTWTLAVAPVAMLGTSCTDTAVNVQQLECACIRQLRKHLYPAPEKTYLHSPNHDLVEPQLA